MAKAFLALGGNLGDVHATFDRAIALLCSDTTVVLRARSSDYRTQPWGVTDQPAFLNAVIAVTTTLSPHALLLVHSTASACLAVTEPGNAAGAHARSTSISWRMTTSTYAILT